MDGVDKTDVVIRPSLHAVFQPRTRDAVHGLLSQLVADGHNVRLEIPDPGLFSAQNSLDAIGIYIAGNVSGTVLTVMTTRLSNDVIEWIRKRFAKDEKAPAVYVTIYGPNGKPMKNVLGRSPDQIKDVTPERLDD